METKEITTGNLTQVNHGIVGKKQQEVLLVVLITL